MKIKNSQHFLDFCPVCKYLLFEGAERLEESRNIHFTFDS